MNRTHIALSSIAVALVLLGPVVSPGIVGGATAAVEDVDDRPDAYAVEQGSDCIQIDPVGDGGTDVVSHYDYRPNANDKWSSHGTTDRQESQVSQLYVYRGSQGDSLVFLHDELNDEEGGGAISMTISGLPTEADWAVEDDDYEGRDDRFQHDGTTSQIDWMWHPERTDGAAVRGIAEPGNEGITIDPAFGEDSYAATQEWPHAEDDLEWAVGDGDGTLVSLDRDEPVTVRQGPCSGSSPPDAELTADPDQPETGENVTLDASGSSDEDGIATYRWDVDGDDEFEAETSDATYVHAYSEAGQVEPTVEVVDGTNETAITSTTIDVQEAASVTAVADVPDTAEVDENVTLDGSNSTGTVEIESYEWSIEDGPDLTGETVSHEFASAGTFNVTLSVESDDVSDENTTRIVINDPPNAELDAPETATAGDTITLDAGASTDDQGISEYRWDVDGNGSTDETTETPQLNVSYDEAGEYTPTVAVIDERGQIDEASRTVEITAAEDFEVDLEANRTTVATGESIAFEATATSERGGVAYEYDFGDATDATGATATHAYEAAGEYTVTVDATSPNGDVATDTTVVAVESEETEPPDDGGGSGDGEDSDSDDQDSGGSGGGGGGGALEPPGTSSIGVANASLSNSTIEESETVRVGTTLANDGDGDGSKDVELFVDGTVVDSTSVFVEANDTRSVGLTHRFEDEGTFDLRVDEVDAGSVTVVEAGATDQSTPGVADESVAVTDLAVPDESVPTGTPARIEATYENDGDSPATFEPTLRIDGEVTSTEEITLQAGGTETVTFERTFSSPGDYEVEVNGTERTVVVGDGAAGTPAETRAGGVPGPIHVVIGVVALLAVVAALSRWM